MTNTILAFLATYWYIIVPIVVSLFLMIPIIVYWERVRYGLMLLRHRLPLIGKMRSWAKRPGEQDPKTHFLACENELCASYYHYYDKYAKDGQFFKKCENYLMKINEDHRSEKGIGLWVLIVALMVIEASAFGYALSPYALTLATPNTALAAAFGFGLVISILALWLSEMTGRQLYLNHMVSQIMSYNTMRERGVAGDFVKRDQINIDNTYDDDTGRPAYQQMLNRVKVRRDGEKPAKSFGVTIGYGVFILILAVGAFMVRTETLKVQEADLIENPPAVSATHDGFPSAEESFPITDDMKSDKEAAASKSAQDQIDAIHRASLVTFAVLSALFVFIQFTSTYLAYSRGFAGNKSKEAWERTHGFANADEFVAYHSGKARSVAVDAQQSLGTLQALLSERFHISGEDTTEKETNKHARTFERYIENKNSEKLLKNTERAFVGMLENLLKQSTELSEKGDSEGAKIAFNKAAQLLAKMPIEGIPDSMHEKLKAYEQRFAVLENVFAPAQTHVSPDPIHAAPAPTAENAQPSRVVTVSADTDKPVAFDPHAWGKLTDLTEDDLPGVALDLGIDVQLIRRAFTLQKLGRQAT